MDANKLKGGFSLKILIFFALLALSLISTTNADLDTNGTPDPVIAVYHFESVKQNELVKYTEDNGPRNFHGALLDGATLSNRGKSGKCLQLENKATLGAATLLSPTLAASEFTITAWVKLPPQGEETVVNLAMLGHNRVDKTLLSMIVLGITPSGNLKAGHENLPEGISVSLESENQNVTDNKWHHIAFAKYANTYTLFIDGEIVVKRRSAEHPKFLGELTTILIGVINKPSIIGSVLVDEVGFFETGFSIYEIKGLYNDGLSEFLEAMDVEGKVDSNDLGEIRSQ